MNEDFDSVWRKYSKSDCLKYTDEAHWGYVDKPVAEYFFNAGVASTKRKPEQVPALFKPKNESTN